MKKLNQKGFTLIELLIVIAILATLAIVVLLALDPVQQLARTRDSGRSSTVAQLGHAMEAWGTVRNGTYPTAAQITATWITDLLVDSGEIKTVPNATAYSISGTAACTSNNQNNICLLSDEDSFVIFATAEAKSNIDQCSSGTAFFVYSSLGGRGGIMCAAPNANTAPSNFIN